MKDQLLKLKIELKALTIQIRELKSKRKELKGYVPGLHTAQENFRTKHIVRCMLRGRTLEQIEPKLRDPNSYVHGWVRKQAAKMIEEIKQQEAKKLQESMKAELMEGENGEAVRTIAQ